MTYQRIVALVDGFSDDEAASVERLRDAWVEQRSGLAEGGALSEFNEKLVRRWAIETGIIERLYSLDRGTTQILVERGLEASLIEHGASDLPATELVEILRDHRQAAEYVFDHVTNDQGLTVHFVRSTHELLTRHQESVEVEDHFGSRFQTQLVRGQWKPLPNNPRRPDGLIHEYCPPVLVEEEMQALLATYRVMEEAGTPTVTRAAWLHHRFTQIHPFQDGNGRVARALTAYVFVRANCFPIVVDRDLRGTYIDALEAADAGDLRRLVRMFAMLEKRELEQALSLSEASLTDTRAAPETSLREQLLSALRARAREKREAITVRRKHVMGTGQEVFESVVRPQVNILARELQNALSVELPGTEVRVTVSVDDNRHYFKTQIVQMARRDGYYCDLETFHLWSRLQLQRPDDADRAVSEMVISLHSLGRQFTGVLSLAAYFATRLLDEEGRSVSSEPHPLAERSLSFSYLEPSDEVERRVREWLEEALNVGIEQIRQSL